MKRREALQRTALIMGTALTPGLSTALLNGCSTAPELNWEPKFLTASEASITGQIADRIIPPTETPGALDVGVDQFIDRMLSEVYSEKDGQDFKDGLKKLDEQSELDFGKKFSGLEPEEADQLLRSFEENNERVFQISKELTLVGYFTSEEGMKSNFEYRPVPGSYQACVDYNPGDKVWIGNHVFNM